MPPFIIRNDSESKLQITEPYNSESTGMPECSTAIIRDHAKKRLLQQELIDKFK